MTEKLKPCPFCGNPNVEIKDDGVFNHAYYGVKENPNLHFYAFCPRCGARSDVCSDEETVAEIWNRRNS